MKKLLRAAKELTYIVLDLLYATIMLAMLAGIVFVFISLIMLFIERVIDLRDYVASYM